jgi:hypothetical protein
MKLTKSKLRQIIKEEIGNLTKGKSLNESFMQFSSRTEYLKDFLVEQAAELDPKAEAAFDRMVSGIRDTEPGDWELATQYIRDAKSLIDKRQQEWNDAVKQGGGSFGRAIEPGSLDY